VSKVRLDKELEQYRSLMEVPGTFEDGFSWTSLAGAIFVALLMVPGAMYMQLLAGYGIGPAAQWVTVILFIEVARRAHKTLRRSEVFVLFYMAGAVMAQPFSGLLYNQFFAQSNAAVGMGIADKLPNWFAPSDSEVLAQRSFLNPAWYPAIGLVIFQLIMGRLNTAILSYGLFRLASDVEKLPFPMAPIGAQGITALSEQQYEESARGQEQSEGNWRWRIFSIGGVLGLSFGCLYTALPAISTAVLDQPIVLLPIPFADWTPKTAKFLPAVATGITFDMGQFVFGMVLPFFAVLGTFLGYMMQVIANPFLYRFGYLPNWNTSDDTIMTLFHNFMDFYFSFGLGLAVALALVGFWQVGKGWLRFRAEKAEGRFGKMDGEEQTFAVPEGRGDIKLPWILLTYFSTTGLYIMLSGYLIDWDHRVMATLVFFGFAYTPIISYVTARLEGTAGQAMEVPYVREAAFILSGYNRGVNIWFLPVPMADYGQRTVFYRQAELTGTSFWSIWKSELILVPIIIVSSIMFAQFIWGLAPIPGAEYPYAEKMWELNAATRSVIITSTLGRFSPFQEAFNGWYLAAGTGVGLAMFGLMSVLQLPIMLSYGLVKGLNQSSLPHAIPLQFVGALVGRFYFERKMGLKWRQYVPVVAAGFSCGMGLITVLGVGVNFLAKSVIKIPF
jgi:hypothetical protein